METHNSAKKTCLVLDRAPYRYQKFCSDIAGQDIRSHSRKVELVIRAVRNFLRNASPGVMIPGDTRILRRYTKFSKELPTLCRGLGLKTDQLIFNDYTTLVSRWLKQHVQPAPR